MRNCVRAAIAIIIAAGLAACAGTPAVQFSQEAKQAIKRIAIVDTPEPEQYVMYPGPVPGGFMLYAFGALGGAVLGGIEASRIEAASKSFTAAISPLQPDISSIFHRQIESGLQSKGYQARRVPPPPKTVDGKDYDPAKIDGDFDAVFITSLNGGYSVEGPIVAPRVAVSVRLVAKSGEPVYFAQDYLYAGRKIGTFVHLVPDSRFNFASPDLTYQNGPLAAEALQEGARRIADQVLLEF